jgi:hypothetical protein
VAGLVLIRTQSAVTVRMVVVQADVPDIGTRTPVTLYTPPGKLPTIVRPLLPMAPLPITAKLGDPRQVAGLESSILITEPADHNHDLPKLLVWSM